MARESGRMRTWGEEKTKDKGEKSRRAEGFREEQARRRQRLDLCQVDLCPDRRLLRPVAKGPGKRRAESSVHCWQGPKGARRQMKGVRKGENFSGDAIEYNM